MFIIKVIRHSEKVSTYKPSHVCATSLRRSKRGISDARVSMHENGAQTVLTRHSWGCTKIVSNTTYKLKKFSRANSEMDSAREENYERSNGWS